MELQGQVALVTGAASGLGESTARQLGASAVAVEGDATSEPDTAAAVQAASDLGGARSVVVCAGGATASVRTVGPK